ncbi:MAG: phosphoglycolate phosphatase [Betaproteobacteria bacterium]
MPVDRDIRRLAVTAVLFDLDGTLADSADDLAGALNSVRADAGLPPVPLDAVRAHASSGARGMLQAGMGITPDHPRYNALREAFLDHYAANLAVNTRLFDGVDALLTHLTAHGFRWGIVTNKHTRFTVPVTAALALTGRAGVIVSGDTTPHAKPHPAPLLHAAAALQVAPAACVYVGDDLRDIEAGIAAGMPTLAAAYGYVGAAGNFAQWPATGVINSPLEILDWLPQHAN